MTYSDCFTNEQLHHALAKAVAERDEAREIIAAALSILPCGHIPSHTPESIPDRIRELLDSWVSAERERDEAIQERERWKMQAEQKWGMRRELEELLGVSDTESEEQFAKGVAALRDLIQERDEARAEVTRLVAETPWGANDETKDEWLDRQREKYNILTKENEQLEAEVARLRAASVHVYNSGYHRGHHDTVEGGYVDIHRSDMPHYHHEEANESLQEALAAVRGAPCEVCEGSGSITYNPNLNPNDNAGSTTSHCPHCEGTGLAAVRDGKEEAK
jgi:hypothetical protein